ncbi:hypothetical protein [Candidatus Uabimicrobium sp. HlEnr_7]|uniref:hypothetical protein n=1 Tax=Candidatus Uabimicrobium helgolandensis TaxID=3095367 RepID=UPI003556BBBD
MDAYSEFIYQSLSDLGENVSFHNIVFEKQSEHFQCKLIKKFSLGKDKDIQDLLPCTFCPRKIQKFDKTDWSLGLAEKQSLLFSFINREEENDFAIVYGRARNVQQKNFDKTNRKRLKTLEEKGLLIINRKSYLLPSTICRIDRSFLDQGEITDDFYEFMCSIKNNIPEKEDLRIEQQQQQGWRIKRKGQNKQSLFTLKLEDKYIKVAYNQKVNDFLSSITLWGWILVQSNPQVFLKTNWNLENEPIMDGPLIDEDNNINWQKTKEEIKKKEMDYYQLLKCFQERCFLAIDRERQKIRKLLEVVKEESLDLQYSENLYMLAKLKNAGQYKKYKRGFNSYGEKLEKLDMKICKLQTIINEIDNELLEKSKEMYCK